jgi:hypothetical protein
MQDFYKDVLREGRKTSPRGLSATAKHDTSFSFIPGQVWTRPGMNKEIGFVELLQWIDGSFSIKPFEKYAPKARLDLFTYQSAYGPRTNEQLERVVEELNRDPDSRRGVVTVIKPTDTAETMPCTLSLQFQTVKVGTLPVRGLKVIVTMRSSDLIWGLPTDVIQFGGIAQMVASMTSSIPYLCTINAGNSHVYDDTALVPPIEFKLSGAFQLAQLYSFESYKVWAKEALRMAVEGINRPSQSCCFEAFKNASDEPLETVSNPNSN